MKVLDVSSLHDGIKGMSRQLSEHEKQLNNVESGIRSFVSSKDSFRGKGASAIRRFYEYAHLPFLQFFQTFLANFQSKLQQLQLELDGLEGNSRGFIDAGFLTSELEDGLNQINRMVTELTGETNAQLSRISDIVYLPRLQDHQFHEGIQQAKQSANQTVDKLHQFDHQQTQSFTALIEDLSLLQNYIEEMSQQFVSGKIKLDSFSPAMLQDFEAYGKLQTKLYNQTVMQRWNSEHFPELGVFYPIGHVASFDQWVNPSCARPDLKKKTAGEAFWDFTNGFGAGIISAASDTWDGIKRLATEPDQVLKETIEFLDAVASDPAILLEIGHELYNSYNESVIHGDATSRGEWLGYATTIIGTSVVGDKGLSKVGGIDGKLGTKVETDLNIKLKDQQEKVMSSVKGSSAAGLERVRELIGQIMPNHQLQPGFAEVPHNVMDSSILREKVNIQNQKNFSNVQQIVEEAGNSKRPGGYLQGDVDEHGLLSPGINRAPGNKNIATDNRIQSHHLIQNEWAKRWAIENGIEYNEKKAAAMLLPSSSGYPHAIISSMQRKRRREEGFNTDIRYEFNISYKELVEAGVEAKLARKAIKDAYKYFDSIGGFVK
ncbi:T7SS effector LXG polymorphic toxin [Sutcliffiella horikoshii]|uniref:T7SS effector LXG polymorphic toxin n=1 Tax=Sutcliffiella horikoshii TaxID=79883 RepID=UPI003CF71733